VIATAAFSVELILLGTSLLVLGWDLFLKEGSKKDILYILAFLGTGAATLLVYDRCPWSTGTAFAGFLVTDSLALFGKGIILIATLYTLAMLVRYLKKAGERYAAEFIGILLIASAGATALASSREIITLYISLETLTISSYLLASFAKKDAASNEAGMKYLLLGAFSTALLLFGFSYLYGLTGTTMIEEMASRLRLMPPGPLGVFAVILVVAGLAFKIALVPFHMWAPDVYEGAPTPVTAYLSVASKTAGFMAFIQLFVLGLTVPGLEEVWMGLFGVLAVLTMAVGNLAAIPQTNIKRMMAFSSVGQAGYIILGILAADKLGITAVLYYLFLYAFTNFGIFYSIQLVSHKTGNDLIEDYAGLSRRQPLIAATFLVCLLSLAGVPPLAGFTGKWYLFSAAVQRGYVILVFFGILFSVVSLYYYLQVIRKAYITEPKDASEIPVHPMEKAILLFSIVMTVVLGAFPGAFMRLAEAAASTFPALN